MQWKSPECEIHRDIFAYQCNKVTKLMQESKLTCKYYTNVIKDATDQKKLYNITNKLVHKVESKKLPSRTRAIELAEKCSSYVVRKIADIRVNIEQEQGHDQAPQVYLPNYDSHLSSFMIAPRQEIDKLIKKVTFKIMSTRPHPILVAY